MASSNKVVHEVDLAPHIRLRRIRASKRCAGCHKSNANLLPCGVRLEDTLSDLLDTQIPKGELRLCGACKLKLTATHELFKFLSLIKNTPTQDGTAVRFLNSKTLRTNWLCRRCNKPCHKLADHRKNCKNGGTANQAVSTSETFSITRNKITVGGNGKRTTRSDSRLSNKKVKFNLKIPRESGENQNSVIGDDRLNLNDEYQQQVHVNGERRRDSVTGEMLRRNSVNCEVQHLNTVNGGRQRQDSVNAELSRRSSVRIENQHLNSISHVTVGNNAVKEELIPTQVQTITSVIEISDDEEMPRRASTPRKQSRLEQYFQPGPSRQSNSSAEDNITSTSTEVETAAGRTALQPLTDRLVEQQFTCDVCDRQFTSSKGLRSHKSTKGWPCRTCKAVFCTMQQLAAHKREAHPRLSRADRDTDGPTVCKCCHMEFPTRRKYELHYTQRGGRCHGGAEGLMNSQCDCQLGSPTVTTRRRHSVHQTFCDPSVQTVVHASVPRESTPPRRYSDTYIKRSISITMEFLSLSDGHRYSHRVVAMPPDGSCLFHAISYCVNGEMDNSDIVRSVIVQYVVDHWNDMQVLTCDDRGMAYQSPQAYRDALLVASTFGSACELIAAGSVYPFTFEVYRQGELNGRFDGGTGGPVKRLRFTGDDLSGHYDVCIPDCVEIDTDSDLYGESQTAQNIQNPPYQLLKAEPDLDIHERETPDLMLLYSLRPQEALKASDTPNSEATEEPTAENEEKMQADRSDPGAVAPGDVRAESGTSGIRVEHVRSESEYQRNRSCDSSEPPGPAVKAKSIFSRRQLTELKGLRQVHRRLTVDRATSVGDADFTSANSKTSPIAIEAAVNLVHSMRRMLNEAFGEDILKQTQSN